MNRIALPEWIRYSIWLIAVMVVISFIALWYAIHLGEVFMIAIPIAMVSTLTYFEVRDKVLSQTYAVWKEHQAKKTLVNTKPSVRLVEGKTAVWQMLLDQRFSRVLERLKTLGIEFELVIFYDDETAFIVFEREQDLVTFKLLRV